MRTLMTTAMAGLALTGVTMLAPAANAATEAAGPTASTLKDERFLMDARKDAPAFNDVADARLIKQGRAVCKALKQHDDVYAVIDSTADKVENEKQTVALIANAVIYYCPGQEGKFQ